MRWNRSRWVPRAWATAALMGSAWDTATMVSPGWRATRRSRAPAMRVCISANDSPSGEAEAARVALHRAPLGQLLAASFSLAPVQSPKSHSSRPRSMRTSQARAPWRWARPSRGCARAARRRRRRRRAAMRSATALGRPRRPGPCGRVLGEVQPGARPGRTCVPVVGVWPWRHHERAPVVPAHGGRRGSVAAMAARLADDGVPRPADGLRTRHRAALRSA